MHRAWRAPRRLVLILALVLVMVGVAAAAGPVAFAASPSITVVAPTIEQIRTTGSGFSWGGQVVVEVYDSHYNLVTWQYTTASYSYCSLFGCFPGGLISVTQNVAACWQVDHVIAYDYSTGAWSNWSNVTVACVE